jgi:acyl-CoA thioester hydrolase
MTGDPAAPPGDGRPQATITRRVDWVDTDASGHWHNGAILRFLEAAEDALHEQLGMPELFGHVPRVQLHIDFLGRLWFRDEPTTRLWVESVGTSSMTYGFEVALDGRVVARGTSIVVQADPEGDGSKPWTDDQRARLTGTPLTGA